MSTTRPASPALGSSEERRGDPGPETSGGLRANVVVHSSWVRGEPFSPETSGGLRANVVPLVLVVAAVAMIVVGGLWFRKAHDLRSTPAAQNHALVDSAATAKVEAEVSLALSRVLSYDYAKPAPTRASAEQYLRGEARKDYAELFSALQKRAPQEKLVLTAKVRTAGVRSLHGDQATLLVFLDQTSTRASDHKTSIAAAQVEIHAQDVDGSWHITGLTPL